jgi:hypothetical protein
MVGTSAKDFDVSALNAFISETVVIHRVAIATPLLVRPRNPGISS